MQCCLSPVLLLVFDVPVTKKMCDGKKCIPYAHLFLNQPKTSINTHNSSKDVSFTDVIVFVMSWKFQQLEAGWRPWEGALHNFNLQVSGKHIPANPKLQKFSENAGRSYHKREIIYISVLDILCKSINMMWL